MLAGGVRGGVASGRGRPPRGRRIPRRPRAHAGALGPTVPGTLPHGRREGSSFQAGRLDSARGLPARADLAIIDPTNGAAPRPETHPGGTDDRPQLVRIATVPDRRGPLPGR